MKFLGFIFVITVIIIVGCDNPIIPASTDLGKVVECVTDTEKVDGNYVVRADAVCIDGLFGTPVNVSEVQPQTIEGCEGPFGLDSGDETAYMNDVLYNRDMGVVTDINLERNADGSWYVHECKVWIGYGNEYDTAHTVRFRSPQPAQFEINKGDYISFLSGGGIWRWSAIPKGLIGFKNCELYENISTQSIVCEVSAQNGILKPSDSMAVLPTEEDFINVTCLVLSVNLTRNFDPEPDNPDDYLIEKAVVQCADGNLYIANFVRFFSLWKENGFQTILPYQPGQGTFNEGDVVTLTQIRNIGPNGWYFDVYYEE